MNAPPLEALKLWMIDAPSTRLCQRCSVLEAATPAVYFMSNKCITHGLLIALITVSASRARGPGSRELQCAYCAAGHKYICLSDIHLDNSPKCRRELAMNAMNCCVCDRVKTFNQNTIFKASYCVTKGPIHPKGGQTNNANHEF